MQKSKLLLKNIINENATAITCVVLTTFLFHFSLSAVAVKKRSMPLKSQQEMISKAIVEAETERDLTIRGELLAKTITQHHAKMMEDIASSAIHLKIQSELQKHMKPEVLINAFLNRVDQVHASSNIKIDYRSLISRFSKGLGKSAGGTIAGVITVDGQAPDIEFPVFAFDSHGYFAGETEVDTSSGEYRITDLRAGSYYVITWSHHFVDEIYPDQLAAIGSFEAWRNAQTVDVSAGITTPDINFDLQKGAVISGEITMADGTPLTNIDVSFEITRASSPSVILTKSYPSVQQYYDIVVPGNGEYKISAHVNGFIKEWYAEASDWNFATAITISAGVDSLPDINFTLTLDPVIMQMGAIGGSLRDPDGGADFLIMPVAAFNAVDTSFTGLGVAIGSFFGGSVELVLPQGDYYVYANDPTGGLIATNSAGESYMGVFYPSTPSIDEALTIPVVAGQYTTPDSQFVLQRGGAIAGKVTGPQGEELDSLLVLGFQKEGDDYKNNPDFTKLQLSFGITDSTGNYRLTGLPNGEYVVRTLSSLPLDSINKLIGLPVFPPDIYAGQFVDEYYGDIQNILHFENATPVSVAIPQTTFGIDIQLDPVGIIMGRVTKSEDGSPLNDIYILAVNDTSGYPELIMGETDNSGNYVLGPLTTGSYKILAVSGFQTGHQHLTEFYDGTHIFQDANIVEVNAPQVTENINFTLDRGATIRGFVDLDTGSEFYQAGADTLDGMPVIIYHAETGKVVSYDCVQFNGGFRIDRLLPGSYKALVMPMMNPFASTYAGGGETYDDPLNASIELGFGEVTDTDIEIGRATGRISGRIVDKNTQQPISMIMVIAYDPTGHPVGAAMSDMDFATGNTISSDGSYRITGLRTGSYFLRTFALTNLLPTLESLTGLMDITDFDYTSILTEAGDLFNIRLEAYADKWYPDSPEVLTVDVSDLLINLTSYGIPSERDQSLFPIYFPIPFFSPIPYGAAPVTVTDGAETANINFELTIGALEDLFSIPVQEIPDKFALSQNYPNPFNLRTNFTYSLPEGGFVDLAVYDLLGCKVRTLVHRNVQTGSYSGSWDGRDKDRAVVPSGIYVIRFESQNHVRMIKAILVR